MTWAPPLSPADEPSRSLPAPFPARREPAAPAAPATDVGMPVTLAAPANGVMEPAATGVTVPAVPAVQPANVLAPTPSMPSMPAPPAPAATDRRKAEVLGEAHEVAFGAMGTFCHIVVHGRQALVGQAQARVEELEQRWSRFLPTSELSRINSSPGQPVAVSNDTLLLLYRATEAWRLTEGRYDPTVLQALIAAGYDRSFADPDAGVHHAEIPAGSTRPSPGCAGIELDTTLRTVTVPPGVQLDPGGIGKGLAADIVVDELLNDGAAGVCVNLGGDLRVAGDAPTDNGWVLGVSDPYNADLVIPLRVRDCAIVTSTRLLRRWRKSGREYHHLIDPRTGLPSVSGIDAVTVVGQWAWWSEVMAKAAIIAGMPDAATLLARAQCTDLIAAGEQRYYELDGWVPLVVRRDADGPAASSPRVHAV